METFKCFVAMLVPVIIVAMIVTFDFCFFCFIAQWKDTIAILLNSIIALSFVFAGTQLRVAAQQLTLSRSLAQADSISKVLDLIREAGTQMDRSPALRRFILKGDATWLPDRVELEQQATQIFSDLTQYYRMAHMYGEQGLLRKEDVRSVEYGIGRMFRLDTYCKFWVKTKPYYEEFHPSFYRFVEAQLKAQRQIISEPNGSQRKT